MSKMIERGTRTRMQKSDINQRVMPFLKWPGGKRWFVENHLDLIPSNISRYFEPFAGSASVFFALNVKDATLSDTNEELITTYKALKDRPSLVSRYLKKHARNHSDTYYYRMRASRPRSEAARAARLIYLNRTCWNGLYRVNKRGEFNVPRGTKNSVLFDTDNFNAISERLRYTKIVNIDFERALRIAKNGDFVFIDPPYTVNHNLNGFRKYNEQIFSWDDQIRLSDVCKSLSAKGVRILMTNANHESIHGLYCDYFDLRPIFRKSILAASSRYRNEVSELVIKNY